MSLSLFNETDFVPSSKETGRTYSDYLSFSYKYSRQIALINLYYYIELSPAILKQSVEHSKDKKLNASTESFCSR